MTPLSRFLFSSGARVAIRASAPLFSTLLALVVLSEAPGEVIASLAREAFQLPRTSGSALFFAALAFVLPVWGATRLLPALRGWFRHLPLSETSLRRGMTLALIGVNFPLIVMLATFGAVAIARHQHPSALVPLRWMLIVIAGAIAALPLRRPLPARGLSIVAAVLASVSPWYGLLASAFALASTDFVAGHLRDVARRKPWPTVQSLLTLRLAWRALGARTVRALAPGLLVLGGGSLYAANNTLVPAQAAGAARFSGSLACVLCIASLGAALALLRPAWPWSRSLPWPSARRVIDDAVFLGIHCLPFVAFTAVTNPVAALCVIAALLFLVLRGAEHLRRIPDRKRAMSLFGLEGFLISAALALVPLSALALLAAAWPALRLASRTDARMRVTRWRELHHAGDGDTMSGNQE